MDVLIKTKPDGPVYLFMEKTNAGLTQLMIVGANEFLRIYYGQANGIPIYIAAITLPTRPHFNLAITGGLHLVF